MKDKTVKQKRNKTIEGRQSRKNYKNGKWDNTKIMYGCAKKKGGNKEEPKDYYDFVSPQSYYQTTLRSVFRREQAAEAEEDPYYLHLLGEKFGSGIRYLSLFFGKN
jgi:hypothetical protein